MSKEQKKFKKVSHFARPQLYRRMESDWGICLCGNNNINDYDQDMIYTCYSDGQIPNQECPDTDHFICTKCGRVFDSNDDHMVGTRTKEAMENDIAALNDFEDSDEEFDDSDD